MDDEGEEAEPVLPPPLPVALLDGKGAEEETAEGERDEAGEIEEDVEEEEEGRSENRKSLLVPSQHTTTE